MPATTPPQRNVHLLWFGTAVASACDQLLLVGIPIFALAQLGVGSQWLGYALAMQYLPSLVLAQWMAAVIDRNDRRSALMVGSLLCCISMLLLALTSTLTLQPHLSITLLLALCLLLGVGNAIYTIASAAIAPVIVADRSVTDVLTGQASVRTLWRLLGLAAAGPAMDLLGGSAVLSLVALAFALRGVASLPIEVVATESVVVSPGGAAAAPAQGAPPPTTQNATTTPTQNAWGIVWNIPVLRHGIWGLFLLNLGGSLISGAYFAFTYELLRLSPTMIGVVMLLGTVSALVALRWSKAAVKRYDAAVICGWSGVVAALVGWVLPLMPLDGALWGLGLYHVVFGAVSSIVVVAFTIMRQKVVSNQVLGRVASISATTNAAAIVLGAAASSMLLPLLSVRNTMVVGAALATLSLLPLWALATQNRAK